jgi:hypothetical protein
MSRYSRQVEQVKLLSSIAGSNAKWYRKPLQKSLTISPTGKHTLRKRQSHFQVEMKTCPHINFMFTQTLYTATNSRFIYNHAYLKTT